MAQDPLELALRAVLSPGFVDSLINFLEAFDDYEDRKTEKHADKQLLENALVLYKQGRITRDQFLDVCATLCPEKPIQASQDSEVNLLFQEIAKRKNQR